MMKISHVATFSVDSSKQAWATSYLCLFTVMECDAAWKAFSCTFVNYGRVIAKEYKVGK